MQFYEIKGKKIRCDIRDGFFCVQPRIDGRLHSFRHLFSVGCADIETIVDALNSAKTAKNGYSYFLWEHREYTMLFDGDDNLIIGLGFVYC